MTPFSPDDEPQDGLGSRPSIADIMLDQLNRIDQKTDTLVKSDGAQAQAILDLHGRLTDVEKTVDGHQALLNKAGGIAVTLSALMGIIGAAFWKAIDFFITTKGT